jgi:hypothetical protein
MQQEVKPPKHIPRGMTGAKMKAGTGPDPVGEVVPKVEAVRGRIVYPVTTPDLKLMSSFHLKVRMKELEARLNLIKKELGEICMEIERVSAEMREREVGNG